MYARYYILTVLPPDSRREELSICNTWHSPRCTRAKSQILPFEFPARAAHPADAAAVDSRSACCWSTRQPPVQRGTFSSVESRLETFRHHWPYQTPWFRSPAPARSRESPPAAPPE